MAKYPPLTVVRHISFDKGKTYKRWDDCTDAERQAAVMGVSQKLVDTLQNQINRNPELWSELCQTAKKEHNEWIPA